jgi:hypothetical protein
MPPTLTQIPNQSLQNAQRCDLLVFLSNGFTMHGGGI